MNFTCKFLGISADGVYQARAFVKSVGQDEDEEIERSFIRQVVWDPSHWMNLAVTDIKDGR